MRLLHGSNIEIVKPNLKKCQSRNDFGCGFYLTQQWQRAYLMAKRRASRDGGEPVVTPFMYYPTKAQEHGLKIKEFKGFSAEWSKFIILNRSDKTFTHDYDIVMVLWLMHLWIRRLSDTNKSMGLAIWTQKRYSTLQRTCPNLGANMCSIASARKRH